MIDTLKLYNDFTRHSLGLTVVENFITEGEENEILKNIPETTVQHRKGRGIMRYGSSKCYDNYMKSETLPDFIIKVSEKIVASNLLDTMPNHATINSYFRGGTIPPHIDSTESGDTISILSLLSDCEMIFEKDSEKIFVPLPRRSLVQMRGAIRWNYTHRIERIENLRYSIVFRNSKS